MDFSSARRSSPPIRKRARQLALKARFARVQREPTEDDVRDLHAERNDPRADEEVAALRACLEQLPAQGREMIRLRYFEDLAPGAIAGRLGRPSDAVRQFLLRLRRTLLECVEGRLGMELR